MKKTVQKHMLAIFVMHLMDASFWLPSALIPSFDFEDGDYNFMVH